MIWIPLPKTQRRVKTLRHRLHGDTPTAATVAVTTSRVALLSCKNIFFGSILHLAVHGRSETLPVVTVTVAALGVSSHGL